MKLQIELIVKKDWTVDIDVEDVKSNICEQLKSYNLYRGVTYGIIEDMVWSRIWDVLRAKYVVNEIHDLSDEASMELTALVEDILDELGTNFDTNGIAELSDTD